MSPNQNNMVTDNNPDIIVTLVARSHRTGAVWAHPHNEPFYLPPLCQATSGIPRKVVVSQNGAPRELTPDDDDLMQPSEPALRITFSRKPKNPKMGYVLGRDPEMCDIFLGSIDDGISDQVYAMSLNQYNEVIMKSLSKKRTLVNYGSQEAKRKNFTWVFPPEQESISVKASNSISFSVEIPKHDTESEAYEANCQNFMKLADDARRTLNLSSQQDIRLTSGAVTSHAAAERPFYLRTAKIGDGGFGVVHIARSMPEGRTVAMKQFKSKDAWALEADILRKLSKTPHANQDHIVQFIDYGLEDKPYLIMGLALGGNLEEQSRIRPFTFREIVLILHQMLQALDYLHNNFQITHRDIKPSNILCRNRAHFLLADFGIAKEGDDLKSFNGTKPYMAPEMFTEKLYTDAVDLWALGMAIAWLLSSRPPGYRGIEGPKWCAANVAHFKKYEDRCLGSMGSCAPEQIGLNFIVGRHMLRMKPSERQSAVGCLERGEFLWYMLQQASDGGSQSPTRENPAGSLLNAPDIEDVSEAETEIAGERTLNTDEWSSLERAFPMNGENAQLIDPTSSGPEDSTTPWSNGKSGRGMRHNKPGIKKQKRASQGPMGVRKPADRRNKSSLSGFNAEKVAAFAAQQ